jgi:hypothetical protein
MVAVHMADEYPHPAIDSCPSLKKLALSPFPTIEEEQFGAPPHEHAWKIPKFARDTTACPKKCY